MSGLAHHHLMTEASLAVRVQRKELRRALRAGSPLADVLEDPPAYVLDLPLHELMSWRRGWSNLKLVELGAHAVRDGVNLLVLVGDSPTRTLRWVAARDLELPRLLRAA